MLVMVMLIVMVVRRTSYLLPVTQKKEEKSEDSTVSEFNPQNWLTGSMAPWLHVEEGQSRAEQRRRCR